MTVSRGQFANEARLLTLPLATPSLTPSDSDRFTIDLLHLENAFLAKEVRKLHYLNHHTRVAASKYQEQMESDYLRAISHMYIRNPDGGFVSAGKYLKSTRDVHDFVETEAGCLDRQESWWGS